MYYKKMNYSDEECEELIKKFDEQKEYVQRLNGDIARMETKLTLLERYSLKWNQFLININALRHKREIEMSRLLDLSEQIERQSLTELFLIV